MQQTTVDTELDSVTPRRITSPSMTRLCAELSTVSGPVRAARVQRFWDGVAASGTPLIRPATTGTDQHDVTFLWRGVPDTDRVLLSMSGLDRERPDAALLDRIPDTDIWYACYRLRGDHRSSYRFSALRRGESTAVPRGSGSADPFNPTRLPGRWDRSTGAVFALPDAPADPWPPAVGPGTDDHAKRHRVPSDQLGCGRGVWIYRPSAAERTDPLPVLVLCDGDRWFGELGLADVLDHLIGNNLLPPLQVLAPEAVAPDTRWRELTAHDPFVSFLADELLPWAARRWPLTDDPTRTLIAGQSLGGLTALYAALTRPHRFGTVLAQSASLWWRPGMPSRPCPDADGRWLADLFGAAERLPTKVQLQVGLQEGSMVRHTRELDAVLRGRAVPVSRVEFNGGHDYACWRTGLIDGIGDLLRPGSPDERGTLPAT
ncbi:enterochelin esterase [Microlunatus soli]|uniref:Enterochelin esterase n=1 Tax=Microlunatus soli TaxID=630515 RepID=A0A1H1RLW1_9ACTN|nr:enterochelin esterase [Microlunatus soli]SDS35959.1 enterochelin esterase [Microlunatus soli]